MKFFLMLFSVFPLSLLHLGSWQILPNEISLFSTPVVKAISSIWSSTEYKLRCGTFEYFDVRLNRAITVEHFNENADNNSVSFRFSQTEADGTKTVLKEITLFSYGTLHELIAIGTIPRNIHHILSNPSNVFNYLLEAAQLGITEVYSRFHHNGVSADRGYYKYRYENENGGQILAEIFLKDTDHRTALKIFRKHVTEDLKSTPNQGETFNYVYRGFPGANPAKIDVSSFYLVDENGRLLTGEKSLSFFFLPDYSPENAIYVKTQRRLNDKDTDFIRIKNVDQMNAVLRAGRSGILTIDSGLYGSETGLRTRKFVFAYDGDDPKASVWIKKTQDLNEAVTQAINLRFPESGETLTPLGLPDRYHPANNEWNIRNLKRNFYEIKTKYAFQAGDGNALIPKQETQINMNFIADTPARLELISFKEGKSTQDIPYYQLLADILALLTPAQGKTLKRINVQDQSIVRLMLDDLQGSDYVNAPLNTNSVIAQHHLDSYAEVFDVSSEKWVLTRLAGTKTAKIKS